MRILVVDDFEEARNVTEAALLSSGYSDVVTAESAKDAFDILDAEAPNVDLVLLDIVMPIMDGIKTCAQLRKDARYAKLPIIMLTSLEDMDSLADAFIAGATDYIAKPFTRQELVARIQSILQGKSSGDHRQKVERISPAREQPSLSTLTADL